MPSQPSDAHSVKTNLDTIGDSGNNANRKHKFLGLAYAALAGFSLSTTSSIMKDTVLMNPAELSFYTFLTTIFLTLPIVILSTKTIPNLTTKIHIYIISIGVFLSLLRFSFYASLRLIPLACAATIMATETVLVTVLARIIFGEKFSLSKVSSVIISIFGVVLVGKLPLVIASDNSQYKKFGYGVLLSLAAVVCESAVNIIGKELTRVNAFIVVVYSNVVGATICSVVIVVTLESFQIPCEVNRGLLIAAGISECFSIVLFLKAVKLEEVGTVCLLMLCCDVALSVVYDIIVFHTVLDWYTVSGASTIILAASIITFSK